MCMFIKGMLCFVIKRHAHVMFMIKGMLCFVLKGMLMRMFID